MTMKLNFILAVSVYMSFAVPQAVNAQGNLTEAVKNWPQWRGPAETGAALYGNPPVEFSETKNIKWKIEIPGKGHATPIVWGDQIIVQTAVPTDKKPAPGEPHVGRGSLQGCTTSISSLI